MSTKVFKLLDDTVKARSWVEGQNAMSEMCDIYEGELPGRFAQFFPKATPKHLVQVIPLAWDDLATQVGRLPDLRGIPKDQTKREERAIGLQERIGFSYLRQAQPTGKLFMKGLAWWLQIGRAVAMVVPDEKNQGPSFQLRDPRTCYPGIKKMTNNTIVELSDLTFKYKIKYDEAVRQGLAPQESPDPMRPVENKAEVSIIEYVDDKQWLIVSELGMMRQAEHNLGIVPGHVFERFTPNGAAGKSRFDDQVALMVAMSRLITAKIAYADRLVNPILWVKGHEADLEIGPYIINKLGPSGEMGQINPPTQFQVDQDIQMLNQFSRILNRNPEVRQGEVAAKGSYTSAKTLEQLSDAIDTVVGGDWDIIGPGMEHLLRAAFAMDVALWPDVEKTIHGTMKGVKFNESYTPSKDIAERIEIRVEYGFGVGGYQGFLMHLQAMEAGTMARQTAMEAMPGVSDTAAEQNKIDVEAMDEAGKAMFLQQAAQGTLDMVIWADLRKEMTEKGLPLHEAIIKYQEQLTAQAAQVQDADQGALTAPAPPEEQAQEELPGIPPQVLAGV
jgi:hypothetical protein